MFHISLNEGCRIISLQVYEKYKDQITPRDVIRVSVVFGSEGIIISECQTLRTQNVGRHLPQKKKTSTQQIILISTAPLKFGIKCRYYGSL